MSKRKIKKQLSGVTIELACWAAALTCHTGASAFAATHRADLIDDIAKDGLLDEAISADPDTLRPAIEAALGRSQTGGRLAWEVMLPNTFWHDSDAKLAVLLPEWDVRRGRTTVDYSQEQTRIELYGGRSKVIDGTWDTQIQIDGVEQTPEGEWTTACDFTDDDVQYLELEQPWSGGLIVQRQFLVVRDNRCVLLADSVLPSEARTGPTDAKIEYTMRLPMPGGMSLVDEPETRDAFFHDGSRRGLVVPLSASEWRVGPTNAKLFQSDDHCLVLSASGSDALYAPLWFDFQQRRFKRKRTWRRNTVGDTLRIVADSEAVSYRMQVGSEQWVLYRSLAKSCPRTFLSKHMIADFFAARFDAGDGSFEELVTVDDRDSND